MHAPCVIPSVYVIVGDVSQLSVLVAVPVADGNVLAVHWIVILGGHVIPGATISLTVMTWLHVLKLPQSSCDRQVRVMV